ncbi:MAG: hypothetical protein JXR86_18065 [Spirochaetales bacterium]|nr:hypothetical protein [Spirochaetales bacterium]
MTLSEIYSDAPYEIRLKAPILQISGFIVVFLLAALAVNSFYQGNIVAALFTLPMMILLVSAVILVRQGKYSLAGNLTSYSLTVIIILMNSIEVIRTEQSMASRAVISILLVILSLIFSRTRRDMYVITSLLVADHIRTIIIGLLFKQFTSHTVAVGQQIIANTLYLLIAIVLLNLLRSIFDRVLKDAAEKMKESEERSAYMRELVRDSTNQLSEAQGMTEQADDTASSIIQIDKNIKSLKDQAGYLSRQYDTSRSSLSEINSSLAGLVGIAEEQSANITETSAALEEMVASIKSSSMIIEKRQETVKELRKKAESGSDVVKKTVLSFDNVSKQIESIKGMTKIITEISSQTNLLAMNAAIEAAHAGDRGRGFAVVAGEVRKLAESSSENAKHISGSLGDLVKAIEAMGANMQDTGSAFSSISSEVGQVDRAMDEINLNIHELSRGSEEILIATVRMNDLTSQVNESLDSVSANERNVTDNVDELGNFIGLLKGGLLEIGEGTAHITGAMEKLAAIASRLNNYTRELNDKMLR